MSKRLYILRHAQAANTLNQADIDRPLSDHGILQAQAVGQHLKEIDMALCSSATRTRETLEEAMKHHGPAKKIKYDDGLYCASTQTLIDAVQDEDADNLLLIAHNPGIFQFSFTMAKDEDTPENARLIGGYPPCSLTILECALMDWGDLTAGQNRIIDFIRGDSLLSE